MKTSTLNYSSELFITVEYETEDASFDHAFGTKKVTDINIVSIEYHIEVGKMEFNIEFPEETDNAYFKQWACDELTVKRDS